MKNVDKFVQIIEKIKMKWNITCRTRFINIDKSIQLYLETNNYCYKIVIEKRIVACYSYKKISDDIEIELISDWHIKQEYSTDIYLYNAIDSYFCYMEEYDVDIREINE